MNAVRDSNHIRIYNAFMIKESLKEVNGRFYDADDKAWVIPYSKENVALLGLLGVSLAEDLVVKTEVAAAQDETPIIPMEKKNDSVNNDIARLNGARFVTAIEMQEGKRLSEELIKSMTGGDKLVTRFLYGEFFEYVPQFKVFLAVNHKPNIRDTTNSIWRRIKLIPFTNVFTERERDKQFSQKILKKELPGILAWAVQGCLMWLHSGLSAPDEITQATTAYKAEMDAFSHFFDECCIVKENARVSNKMLRAKYDEWCKENGEYALTQRPFSQKLLERGYEKRNSAANGAAEWYGFALRGEAARL